MGGCGAVGREENPQGKWNKLNSGEKIEEMIPVNKILQESVFGCLLAVKVRVRLQRRTKWMNFMKKG